MLKEILGALFGSGSAGVKNVSAKEAAQFVKDKNAQFIDVRSAGEYQSGHAKKAANFPLDTLARDLDRLDKSKPTYVICQSGMRSLRGASILDEAGFKEVYNVTGGTVAWKMAGLETER
ncbi:MAG: rhodanese-like domain-containing protein [Acidobacteria bacterium]|nr:rhodanese-like domain-containing protein [Acidobacteriota bacterium]